MTALAALKAEAKALGFDVFVRHERCEEYSGWAILTRHTALDIKNGHGRRGTVSSKGGTTIVILRRATGETIDGYAYCSLLDNYNRKLGTTIALGRALKKLAGRERFPAASLPLPVTASAKEALSLASRGLLRPVYVT